MIAKKPEAVQVVACRDCGTPYSDSGRLDMVLPDQQWKKICPEDGILCPNCICKRAEKFGGRVVLAWIDQIDYAKR
jgi:hypothetical protein